MLWLQEVTLGRLCLGGLYRRGGRRPPQRAFSPGQDRTVAERQKRLVLETINHLVVLAVALFLVFFGFIFFLLGFGIYSQPSGTPLAVITVVHPHLRLADSPVHHREARQRLAPRLRGRGRGSPQNVRGGRGCRRVSEWTIVGLMAFLFVLFGVLGVPVPFAVMASVIIGVLLTDISLTTVVAEMFNGINAVPLLAVPFFILARRDHGVLERHRAAGHASPRRWSATFAGAWPRSSPWSACSSPGSPAPRPRTLPP